MKALIAALLFAVVNGGEKGGTLYVHVMPGLQILVDGVDSGVANQSEGGKMIHGVAAGAHRVVVRTPDGREASFNVSILNGQTSDVTVNPLGFRKLNRPAEDDTAMLRVTSIPNDSLVEFHGITRENHDGSELTFDAIPAGTYPITITQNGKAVRSQIEMPKASVVTVDVNFRSGTIKTTETKPRPRRLQINDPNDALTRLDIPNNWKTSIRSALPATVSLLDAYSQGNAVKVRVKIPSEEMGDALLESLSSSSAFTRVTLAGYPRREQIGWVADFVFYFPVGR